MRPKRSDTILKISKPVELTNVQTNEVLIFRSLNETVAYVKKFFPKVSPGTLSVNVREGSLYKKIFKLKYINNSSEISGGKPHN